MKVQVDRTKHDAKDDSNPNIEKDKRQVRKLDDIRGNIDIAKVERLGNKIAELSSLISDYEDLKRTYLAQLFTLTGDIDYNIRGDSWTYEQVSGRTYLSEQRLLEEGIPARIIAKCKVKGESYRQVRRDKEKKKG